MRRRCVMLAWVTVTIAMLGCSESASVEDSQAPTPVSRQSRDGPVEMVVTVDRHEAMVGDALLLRVEVTAPQGYRITMPEVVETLGPFDVDAASTPPDLPVDGKRRWRHEYTLSTFESGEVEIPTIELSYLPPNAAEGETAIAMTTEAIPVHLTTAIATDESPEQIRDIQSAVEVPFDRPVPWLMIGIIALGVVLFAALALVLWRLLRGGGAVQPPVPAHVWALGQLSELRASGLIEQSAFEPFYTRLSGVVRQYIERRFALRAPEQTTDEFLRDAQRSRALNEGHKVLLTGFLRAADQVKFALHRPTSDEALHALDSAEHFVQQTVLRPHEEPDIATHTSAEPVAAGGAT